MNQAGNENQIKQLHERLDADTRISAPILWELAQTKCYRDPSTGRSCMPYHRIWQYLKLLGLTKSIKNDSDFIVGRLRGLARQGNFKHVLISGTADYSMLAHVHWAYMLEDCQPDINIVDICDTALYANNWYAERYNIPVCMNRCDLLKYTSNEKFDLVCTHNILNFFSPPDQVRLIRKWYGILRPGGVVITTFRLRDGPHDEPSGFSDEQARSIRQRAYRESLKYQGEYGIDPDKIADSAYEFATSHKRYATSNEKTVYGRFAKGNLLVVNEETSSVWSPQQDLHGRPQAGKGNRLRIVAIKDS